ncbi:MAG TPA: prolyl oligopeptidase family serine peptidase [Bacteroidota bacterium]|nr:prolyl oligopeptidase family serine peptidase [Bacteroidota bacterium]
MKQLLMGCVMAATSLTGCGSAQEWMLATGQHPQAFEKRITKTVSYRFLLYLPKSYGQEPQKKWPLVFFLHGSGESGDDIRKVKVHGPPKLVETDAAFPFIVVSPQNQVGTSWSVEGLNALLDEVVARLPIDEDRVYLTGLSRGGYGTWHFACAHPERFAAIAPVCGGGYPDAVCRLKNVPVWVFHGAKDPVINISESYRMVDPLKECGGDVRFTIYPEAGHDAWTETYMNPELYTWFLSHTRKR